MLSAFDSLQRSLSMPFRASPPVKLKSLKTLLEIFKVELVSFSNLYNFRKMTSLSFIKEQHIK